MSNPNDSGVGVDTDQARPLFIPEAQWDLIVTAVRDVLWKATQYGETEDGDTRAYILPKGAVHRLVGAMQGAGVTASLRNESIAKCGCTIGWWDESCELHRPDSDALKAQQAGLVGKLAEAKQRTEELQDDLASTACSISNALDDPKPTMEPTPIWVNRVLRELMESRAQFRNRAMAAEARLAEAEEIKRQLRDALDRGNRRGNEFEAKLAEAEQRAAQCVAEDHHAQLIRAGTNENLAFNHALELNSRIEALQAQLAEAERQSDAAVRRMRAAETRASEQIRLRALAEIERDEALAQLAKIREALDILEQPGEMVLPPEHHQCEREVTRLIVYGLRAALGVPQPRRAPTRVLTPTEARERALMQPKGYVELLPVGVPQPEPGNATEPAAGLHGVAENVTPVGVPQEQASTEGGQRVPLPGEQR